MMKAVKECFTAHVFDSYEKYSRVISNSFRLADLVESIIARHYRITDDGVEGENMVVEIAECNVGDYHHFRYYILLCYDCYLEEKKGNKDACVKYPVASCTVIEALSEDEEHVDEVKIVGTFSEPPGRGWVELHDIMRKAVARIFNRVFVLRVKRVCW